MGRVYDASMMMDVPQKPRACANMPLPQGVTGKPNTPELVQKDLSMLALFVRVYCEGNHAEATKAPFVLKGFDVPAISGREELCLCPGCTKLLMHAFIKRQACPMDPKPMCKHCPSHCYAPLYRQQIREVMKYSGRKLVLRGRLDMLIHLWF